MPDERQLTKGIKSTDVPAHLQSMVDSLVWESTRVEEGYVCVQIGRIMLSDTLTVIGYRGTGACLEYLLKNGLDIAILGGVRKVLTAR